MIKILVFWDIYGRVGRNTILKNIDWLKKEFSPDFILANVDNVSSWRWAIEKHIRELESTGIDAFSSWDHIFDNEEKIADYLKSEKSKMIVPANFYPNASKPHFSKWYTLLEKIGKKW